MTLLSQDDSLYRSSEAKDLKQKSEFHCGLKIIYQTAKGKTILDKASLNRTTPSKKQEVFSMES